MTRGWRDAADKDQLRTLLAQRARLHEYKLQFLHLGVPLLEGEDLMAQNVAEEEEDLLLLEGEGGYMDDGDGGILF